MNLTVTCSYCRNERPAQAQFCSKCGNALTQPTPTPATPDAPAAPAAADPTLAALPPPPITPCPWCGAPTSPMAQFCQSCGTRFGPPPGTAITQVDDPFPLDGLLDAYERHTSPAARTILIGGAPKKRPLRLELMADDQGALAPADRQRLKQALADVMVWDGYLRSDVTLAGGTFICVWHIINGGAFPLSAEHTTAVIDYHDTLVPTFARYTVEWPVAAAPPIDDDTER